ncbi:MAG: hypothetical protein ACT4PV_10860 [Planctomycetaceae bacterium]
MGRSTIFVACAALAFLQGCAEGSSSEPTWAKSYGALLRDAAASGEVLPDGSHVVAATRDAVGTSNMDAWVVGLDAYGDPLWERVLGRSGGSQEDTVVVPASLGAAFVVSTLLPEPPDKSAIAHEGGSSSVDLIVTYIDGAGRIAWQRRYGLDSVAGEHLYFADEKPDDFLEDAQSTPDGGLVLAAVSHARIDIDPDPRVAAAYTVRVPWVARLAPNGDVLWQRQIVDDIREYVHEYPSLHDRPVKLGVAVGGNSDVYFWARGTFSNVGLTAVEESTRFGRIDSGGVVRWHTFEGNFDAVAGAVNELGRLFLLGRTYSSTFPEGSGDEVFAALYEQDGRELWYSEFGDLGRYSVVGAGIAPCPAGASCEFVGVLWDFRSATNWLIRFDPQDGGRLQARPLAPANGFNRVVYLDVRVAVTSHMDGDVEYTELYGPGRETGVRRVRLNWEAAGEEILDLGDGDRVTRDADGETCIWSRSGRVRRLDAALAMIWDANAFHSADGPDRERVHDVHLLAIDPARKHHDGYVLIGSWEFDYEQFGPWIARLDVTGLPVWSRLVRTAEARRPPASSAVLADASVLLAHGKDNATVLVTRILGNGEAAWRIAVPGSWQTKLFALGATAPAEFATVSAVDSGFEVQAFDQDGSARSSYRVRFFGSVAGPAPGSEVSPVAAVCTIDRQGALFAGAVRSNGGAFSETPHVFVVDMAPDGAIRHASMRRWDAPWVIGEGSYRVVRGSEGDVYVAATIENDFGMDPVTGENKPLMRPSGQDWILMRVSATGGWDWAQAYGGMLDERLSGLRAVPGGALLVGRSDSVEVRGDAWVLRVGPDGHIAADGRCQAELERVEGGETLPFEVDVEVQAPSATAPEAPPFEDIIEVVTPSLPVTDTVVARQCLGFTTPPPDTEEPPPPGPPPAEPADLIVFSNKPPALGEDTEIWVIDAAGGGRRQLTVNVREDWDPAWSPDRAQIAFVSNSEGGGTHFDLMVMPFNGADPAPPPVTPLTNFTGQRSARDPAWSPVAGLRKVACAVGDAGYFDRILIFDLGMPPGTPPVEISTLPHRDIEHLSWSPDGARIAYCNSGAKYVVPADGATAPTIIGESLGLDWSVDWGPVGFVLQRYGSVGRLRIVRTDSAGSGPANVTAGGAHQSDLTPSWSPMSDRIVFARQNNELSPARLWLVDATGTNSNAAEIPNQPDGSSTEPDWGFGRLP